MRSSESASPNTFSVVLNTKDAEDTKEDLVQTIAHKGWFTCVRYDAMWRTAAKPSQIILPAM